MIAGGLLLGQFLSPGFFMSLTGALLSLLVLALAIRLPRRWFGPVSWSILAAFAHIGGQLLLARLWLIPHNGLFYLVPLFASAALVFGIINGLIAARLLAELPQISDSAAAETAEVSMPKTICLAFTGASGMPYGMRLLECLLAAGCRVQLLYSQVAQIVARQEMGLELPARAAEAQDVFRASASLRCRERSTFMAARSGSRRSPAARIRPTAMVVCPCTMGTLASIAAGAGQQSDRARRRRGAQGRPQADSGAARNTVFGDPSRKHAAPGACRRRHPAAQSGLLSSPASVEDLVDFVVARILDQLGVPTTLMARWGEPEE